MPELPHEALKYLRCTHAAGATLLAARGLRAEAEEVAIEVERHRWFWRPSSPRILLVAESHVCTSDHDRRVRVDPTKLSRFGNANASPPPESFVRLVYCLGYGEPQLLNGASVDFNNPGTPRYWDIFDRVTGRGPQLRTTNGNEPNTRLVWKIETLREMCRRRIWLLDASVHAIYLGHGDRLPRAIKDELHWQWWGGYGRYVINSCGDAKIWVIGKTVFDCLNAVPDWNCRGWVYQPNYDFEKNWPRLLGDCGN